MAGVAEEQALIAAGYRFIAGVDEVGRGCWAGPVVAAAVIFNPSVFTHASELTGIDDSKQLAPQRRREQALRIEQLAVGIGVGIAPAFVVDAFGIAVATKFAMIQAVLGLPCVPDALLIDWVRLDELPLPQRSFARADAVSVSVAAASIIAKTRRDAMMEAFDGVDGRYGWASHKGYGTAVHQRALTLHGPCPLHRRSFKPVAAYIND